MLFEKIKVYQQDEEKGFLPLSSNATEKKEQGKAFVVVELTDNGNDATFFDDIHQAQIFYEKLSGQIR